MEKSLPSCELVTACDDKVIFNFELHWQFNVGNAADDALLLLFFTVFFAFLPFGDLSEPIAINPFSDSYLVGRIFISQIDILASKYTT